MSSTPTPAPLPAGERPRRPAGAEGGVPRRLLVAGLALLVVLGLALLVERAAGYRGLLDRLRTAEPGWLLLALVAETASFAGFIAALRLVTRLEGGPRLSFGTAARIVFASLGAARAVAGGGPAGIAVLYWATRKAGAGRDRAAIRVFALYALLFGVFGSAAWLAALAVLVAEGVTALPELTLPWLLAVPLVLASGLSFRAPARRRAVPGRLGTRLRTATADAAAGLALVRRLVAHPRASGGAPAAAALYWLGDAACLWAALRAFDVTLGPTHLFLAYATAYLTTLLPLPLGGVGGVEAATTVALGAVGAPVPAALLAVLAYRGVTFWLPTLPGLAAFATLGGLGRDLERRRRNRGKGHLRFRDFTDSRPGGPRRR